MDTPLLLRITRAFAVDCASITNFSTSLAESREESIFSALLDSVALPVTVFMALSPWVQAD
ncbi:hypothetical protein EBA18_24720 (plasmid) [Xanthomonas oryzae pv. oryzae]|nr:hypothetical protein EBA18_24720 [Xanthomonas oryzae pv. oryzae]QEJ71005.1 hypothetical protein BXO1_024860 [Xanthomonas oryzae pv. oryzae]